jgi:hypothetical protein
VGGLLHFDSHHQSSGDLGLQGLEPRPKLHSYLNTEPCCRLSNDPEVKGSGKLQNPNVVELGELGSLMKKQTRKPPVLMRHADICEVEIEGISTLRNPINAGILERGRKASAKVMCSNTRNRSYV